MHLEIFTAVTEGQTLAALRPLRPLFYLNTQKNAVGGAWALCQGGTALHSGGN